jgi:hypothetical protein
MNARQIVSIALSAVTVTCGISAGAQDANSAKLFVESLYRHYANHGSGLDFSGTKALKYLDPSLNALLDADVKAVGPNEVGVLDGDPICSCQDWDGIWNLKIDIQRVSPERALAAVSFALFDPKDGKKPDLRALKMTLAAQHGEWRIWDIVDNSDPKAPFALRAELKKEIAVLAQHSKSKAAK